ncbi:MAG: hypothetical protein ABS62_02350 [Microbacterium sp. SCN 70-200]|uniref:hypothetical protein n=1 Tax=unclassified Microbacterium TaxID=2609290 RepID=UPI00086DF516|nr:MULTISPECIES: hypothetical protein [unclassified Microbacterium]MBN9215336.1 hypothetical protein [Microbacterium sp.]ODT42732.1 MAG: hypothetical protein ABS62_02350 [Microbacterium sp. SCN 70-200]OJV79794.1 MAG: hypothetical protein BGO46_10045 [Microbacterium sp. 70-16]
MTLEANPLPDVLDFTGRSAYLDRREAAAYCRVPMSTFDSLRRRNQVPHPDAEMGKHMLWKRTTLEDFLEAGGTRNAH